MNYRTSVPYRNAYTYRGLLRFLTISYQSEYTKRTESGDFRVSTGTLPETSPGGNVDVLLVREGDGLLIRPGDYLRLR